MWIYHIYNQITMDSPTLNQTLEQQTNINQTNHEIFTAELTQTSSSSLPIYLFIAAVIILLFLLLNRKKNTPNQREIALIGERGSGKTQLFISLCGGKAFETVPSISNNSCQLELNGK